MTCYMFRLIPHEAAIVRVWIVFQRDAPNPACLHEPDRLRTDALEGLLHASQQGFKVAKQAQGLT